MNFIAENQFKIHSSPESYGEIAWTPCPELKEIPLDAAYYQGEKMKKNLCIDIEHNLRTIFQRISARSSRVKTSTTPTAAVKASK